MKTSRKHESSAKIRFDKFEHIKLNISSNFDKQYGNCKVFWNYKIYRFINKTNTFNNKILIFNKILI